MMRPHWPSVTLALLVGSVGLLALANRPTTENDVPAGRSEVVFWHFWGGQDRPVVDDIVARFNASQDEYFVRAIAMPGNNLDLKFFLATTGGDPPDVVNQDDPIVADWAFRNALTPLDELASAEEMEQPLVRALQWPRHSSFVL
jgi:multiple sugar transport system substrate-binding protein